ncbi:alpha/beta hydrolase [Hydrogenophaga sp. 5NK40-0174]|uniref:alpha/beta hydrolase n=1 Tax=Hydrogenophaga sp. 5NK40-0174 TaxID=3127649 RepID=UPI003106298E
MSLIVFSHANSFPLSTYSVMFKSLRARGYTVRGLEKIGHDPGYPVTNNWPHLIQQLADYINAEAAGHEGELWLVGHSLGGFLSCMCAAVHPVLAGKPIAGVVMLDSPLISGWKANVLGLAKHTQLAGSLSPGRVSRKRRNSWPSRDDVLSHFQHKRAFARWDPQVLQDYVDHGTHDHVLPDGSTQRVLSFDRDVETLIYNTLPHNVDSLLRRHPLQCPLAFIGGQESTELRHVGLRMTRKVIGTDAPPRLTITPGSHLFPMEKPLETAALVDAAIKSMNKDLSHEPVQRS